MRFRAKVAHLAVVILRSLSDERTTPRHDMSIDSYPAAYGAVSWTEGELLPNLVAVREHRKRRYRHPR